MKKYLILSLLLAIPSLCFGWHDETHMAIAQAAGDKLWYNAAGADIAKIKAGKKELYNHWHNGTIPVTLEIVWGQIKKYNNPKDEKGHLYGAIVASLRAYQDTVRQGKFAGYHFAYVVHYAGDLSQPLHHIPYDEFNKANHIAVDGAIENAALANVAEIKKRMYTIVLEPEKFEEDLVREIARIAEQSRQLGLKMKEQNRQITVEEAYTQAGHSASLLAAIIRYCIK